MIAPFLYTERLSLPFGQPATFEKRGRKLYTKHHLKFGKNQADNLVAVENSFILDFGADFFLYFIGV